MSKEKQTFTEINNIIQMVISVKLNSCEKFEHSFRKEKEGLYNYVTEIPEPFLNIYIDLKCKEVIIWRAPDELTDAIKKLTTKESGIKLIIK